MEGYSVVEISSLDEKSSVCGNCKHCYIPKDFLLGLNKPEFFCDVSKDRPRSGDIMSEPFFYYDKDIYANQFTRWNLWAQDHFVEPNGTCSLFEGITDEIGC